MNGFGQDEVQANDRTLNIGTRFEKGHIDGTVTRSRGSIWSEREGQKRRRTPKRREGVDMSQGVGHSVIVTANTKVKLHQPFQVRVTKYGTDWDSRMPVSGNDLCRISGIACKKNVILKKGRWTMTKFNNEPKYASRKCLVSEYRNQDIQKQHGPDHWQCSDLGQPDHVLRQHGTQHRPRGHQQYRHHCL